MGVYRLFLAGLVVAGHVGVRFGPYDPGVIAVVSFFLLSGYVMTALIDRHYAASGRIGPYYADRALRLFPQFLFYSLATIAAAAVGLRHDWLAAPPSALSDLAQLTILPLNFLMLFPDMLLPQAWSLGLEAFFYLLMPFLLQGDKRLPFLAGSLTIFALAYAGRLPQEWFGYRLLPGVLFVFLLGSLLRRPDPRFGRAPALGVFALAVAALAAGPWVWARHVRILDVTAGLVVGLPIVAALARARVSGRLDTRAGDISYGLFLNHMLILPVVEAWTPHGAHTLRLACVLPLGLGLSYATWRWIERPALALRHRLRGPAGARPTASCAPPPGARQSREGAKSAWAGYSSASMSARRARARACSTKTAG